MKSASEIIENILESELDIITEQKRKNITNKICKELHLENVNILDLSNSNSSTDLN